MVDDNELMKLRDTRIPTPDPTARERALRASVAAFEAHKNEEAAQASADRPRLTERAFKLWRDIMQKKMIAAPALGALVALPIAGYVTMELVRNPPASLGTTETSAPMQTTTMPKSIETTTPKAVAPPAADAPATSGRTQDVVKQDPLRNDTDALDGVIGNEPAEQDRSVEMTAPTEAPAASPPVDEETERAAELAPQADQPPVGGVIQGLGGRRETEAPVGFAVPAAPTAEPPPPVGGGLTQDQGLAAETKTEELAGIMPRSAPSAEPPPPRGRVLAKDAAKLTAPSPSVAPPLPPSDMPGQIEENRDRIEAFKTNPVKSALEDPVSTFSIDVDTASYSFVRGSLKQGFLPQPDTVRVEEMINYFPYDWKGPDSAATPFNTTVSVMPTPWNANTKLMHVAIKGFDVIPAQQPKANLVFLIDVSGSMDAPDKLPLLRSAFRLLVSKLRPDDTVSIVTYAGNAGTVLEPTKVTDKDTILFAIDNLKPGGSTAGEAGIREAYRLAQQSFVQGGVNRVMLATDGDFNVGQTNDDDLKRLIEEKRASGVFLSVFGFGRGNLNDQMMQTIAQNGNGTAAYIDTLAEAEKVLVEDSSSTLFTIAKDVKIQVEFNPQAIAEYRLIGYETRALAREDFNNDKVDAGEIGSGHSVTAIYEVTPKGSPAQQIDDLRYGQAQTNNQAGIANADEYAFVKIRYKLPDEDISKLITQPVSKANETSSFDTAGVDQRFSIAVAAFGQKLRGEGPVSGFGYDRIAEIATAARGADPFGYRAEFLSLVRLASALDTAKR